MTATAPPTGPEDAVRSATGSIRNRVGCNTGITALDGLRSATTPA
jgi:hypothetical protein